MQLKKLAANNLAGIIPHMLVETAPMKKMTLLGHFLLKQVKKMVEKRIKRKIQIFQFSKSFSLESVFNLSFCRFSGSFEPIFDSNCRDNINLRILPLQFESTEA